MVKRKSSPDGQRSNKRDRRDEEEEELADSGFEPSAAASQLSGKQDHDVGIVESITLKNFMCHSNLGPCHFGPNVNFVVGRNGSGKTAILTGLILALGGNAQTTTRGSSLKAFVKEGESSADVSVTLYNQGEDAYKPDVFGDSITVNMKITREGARVYKLKDQQGKVVTNKKEELQAVLDHYNIQVHNPMSVLTQEMSKQFLSSSKEEDKYAFFMKATQLEQMETDYNYVKLTRGATEGLMEKHRETTEELKIKYLEAEKRYKSLESLEENQVKLEKLQKQMAWALVNEMEREAEPLRQKLEADNRLTVKFDQKVEASKESIVEAERNYQEIQDQVEAIAQRLQGFEPQCVQLKAEVQKRHATLKAAEANLHGLKRDLLYLQKDKCQLTARIQEIESSQETEDESHAREERKEKLEEQLEDLRLKDETLCHRIEMLKQASGHATDELGKMRRELDALRRSLDNNRRIVQNLENSRSNRLRRFGEQMPALLGDIQQAYNNGRFKQRPRGPLGFCICLKDPELALAVEVCLKGQMLAFVCDNYDDEKLLQSLMGKRFPAGRRPGIITTTFLSHVHDTSKRAVNHPKYPSVLQALEIEDPVVANCLIDQRGIESILLIKNCAEARRIMQFDNPPKNCTQAFSMEGDQIFSNRNYSSDQHRAKYLTGDVEEEIRHRQAEVENQMVQAERFQQQMKRVEEELKGNEALLRKAQVEQKQTKDRARELTLELTDLQNVEEPQPDDLKPLEDDVQETIAKISAKQAECEEAQAQTATLKESFDTAEKEYRQHKELIGQVAEKAEQIKVDLSKRDAEVTKCRHHKQHYEAKRKVHISNIDKLKAELRAKEREIEASAAKASEICPERMEVRRTAKTLDNEINRTKACIAVQQKQHGSHEEIIREYHEATMNYKSMAQKVKRLNRFITALERMTLNRVEARNLIKKFVCARCMYYFGSMLSQRGFSGKMSFNHENKALSISVQPREGDNTMLEDMRSLSGGERSFSTVCFVLSLWGITDAPFRCLDEFDVYMDMVNRRISMDMMLKVASSQTYRQFLFFTPQSMSSLSVNSLIRILRLNSPNRGRELENGEEEDGSGS